MYPNSIKLIVKAIDLAKQEPGRTNLIGMMRIWKAYLFMTMTDTYADVPYSEAGKGDQYIFFPKYDDDAAIYDSLYNEIKGSTDALNPAAEYVSADLFYRSGGTATAQVAQWKKLGNSLLLEPLRGNQCESMEKILIESGPLLLIVFCSWKIHFYNN